MFSDHRCSDPRDVIYALLNLSFIPASSLVPDYNKSTREVYIEATKVIMSDIANKEEDAQPNLNIICSAFRSYIPSQHNLPTWVPEWTIEPVYQGFQFSNSSHNPFRAAGDHTLAQLPTITDSGMLEVQGYFFDDVQESLRLADLYDHDGDPVKTLEEWTAGAQLCEPVDLETRPYPTGESVIEAYWKTLLTNCANGVEHQTTADEAAELRSAFMRWSGRTSDADVTEEYGVSPFRNLKHRMWGWTVCITAKGYFGHVPAPTKKGDRTCVLRSLGVPVVLRVVVEQQDDKLQYELMGPCYVHGIMDGEAVATEPEWDTIGIV